MAGLAFACYRRPVPDDFDRYIYEAVVRGRSQPIDVVYGIVKHENKRTEKSDTLDSPQNLREQERLRAIRPLYIEAIALVSNFLPIQSAISLISAAALFGIGVVVGCWTKRPLESALLMAAYPILMLGRYGSPDSLAALLALSGLWLIAERIQQNVGIALLFVSLGVRTDNVLLLLLVLGWLVWEKRLPLGVGGLLSALAIGTVIGIDRAASNYPWVVLFRLSFIAGRHPSEIPHTLSIKEYLGAFVRGATTILASAAVWLLLGILAFARKPSRLLLVVAMATAAHFVLYPSPEDRYLSWAYIVAGIVLIQTLEPVAEIVSNKRRVGC